MIATVTTTINDIKRYFQNVEFDSLELNLVTIIPIVNNIFFEIKAEYLQSNFHQNYCSLKSIFSDLKTDDSEDELDLDIIQKYENSEANNQVAERSFENLQKLEQLVSTTKKIQAFILTVLFILFPSIVTFFSFPALVTLLHVQENSIKQKHQDISIFKLQQMSNV